eukprot:gene20643-26765_t
MSIQDSLLDHEDNGQIKSFYDGPLRNILLLALAWAFTLTTSTLLTTIGPLSVQSLGASDSFAAFAVGVFLIGAAISSVPSAKLFSSYGRFAGFSVGCCCQFIGSLLGSTAMYFGIVEVVYMGCFFIGLGQGLGQFYRFSAVEVSPPEFKSRAITYVLSGGIIAAFLGPLCADNTADIESHQYLGSYLIIAVIGILNEITICFVKFPKPKNFNKIEEVASEEKDSTSDLLIVNNTKHRTLYEIVIQPTFIVSCAVATLAHTIMVMLMSDVTLAMSHYNFSLSTTSLVMELHFFAMFAPGFISGKLISNYGTFKIALLGGIIFALSIVAFGIGVEAWNFYIGMILLGVGWNFSFSAGTVMLTDCYEPHEATRVQAINDFILFSVAGAGSLASGIIFEVYGWFNMILVSSGLIVLNLILFIIAYFVRQSNKDRSPILDLSRGDYENLLDEATRKTKWSFSERKRSTSRALSFSEMMSQDYTDTEKQSTIRTISVA